MTWRSSETEPGATQEMLEPHSRLPVRPGRPARQDEEDGGAHQRLTLKVRRHLVSVLSPILYLSLSFSYSRTTKSFPRYVRPSPGVSWFISADDLRSEARKENRPEVEEWTGRPSTAWFEAYSRIDPWREPLRQRQVHEDRNHHAQTEVDPRTKPMSSGLTRLSLQVGLSSQTSRAGSLSRMICTF